MKINKQNPEFKKMIFYIYKEIVNQIKRMRTFIYTIFAAFLIIGCKQLQPDNTSIEESRPLKIKVCKMYSSDFVLLDPNDPGQLMQEFRFNRKGFVNELIRYGLDGEIIGRFDIFGENTPFPMPAKPEYVDTVLTIIDIDSLNIIKSKEIKTYNSQGLLIEVNVFENENILISKNTFNYDQSGMIKEDVYWDVDLDKPKQKIRYEFEYFTD